MNYLLDTCVISELAKPVGDSRVLAWAETVNELDCHISALTVGELQRGAARLAAGQKKKRLLTWLHKDLLERFADRVLPVDQEVALSWGKVQATLEKQGRPMPAIDGLIAATALRHGLTIITRNVRDMEASGVSLFNPWE